MPSLAGSTVGLVHNGGLLIISIDGTLPDPKLSGLPGANYSMLLLLAGNCLEPGFGVCAIMNYYIAPRPSWLLSLSINIFFFSGWMFAVGVCSCLSG